MHAQHMYPAPGFIAFLSGQSKKAKNNQTSSSSFSASSSSFQTLFRDPLLAVETAFSWRIYSHAISTYVPRTFESKDQKNIRNKICGIP